MTKEENIATLNEHLDHWKRLLSEKICDQDEGEKTIDALQNAIKALEQEHCENCCNGNQIEKAKLCQKSYLAGMEHKQEPCDDAISRQAAIVALDNRMQSLENVDMQIAMGFAKGIIHELPPVTPMQKWIPCSERLPNFAGVYLVTRYFPNNVMNPTYLVDACFFDGTDTWHNDNRINHDRKYLTNVVAWLEEPEPYKEIPTVAESEG